MNEPGDFLDCPRCGADLSQSSGIVCPACSLVLKQDFDEGVNAIEQKRLARLRFHQLAWLLWFFAPPVVGVVSALLHAENLAVVAFYASPFFGAAAGVHLGMNLFQKFGYSRWYCIVYAIIGAFVCPVLTFGGCALGFRAG